MNLPDHESIARKLIENFLKYLDNGGKYPINEIMFSLLNDNRVLQRVIDNGAIIQLLDYQGQEIISKIIEKYHSLIAKKLEDPEYIKIINKYPIRNIPFLQQDIKEKILKYEETKYLIYGDSDPKKEDIPYIVNIIKANKCKNLELLINLTRYDEIKVAK